MRGTLYFWTVTGVSAIMLLTLVVVVLPDALR